MIRADFIKLMELGKKYDFVMGLDGSITVAKSGRPIGKVCTDGNIIGNEEICWLVRRAIE